MPDDGDEGREDRDFAKCLTRVVRFQFNDHNGRGDRDGSCRVRKDMKNTEEVKES